MRSQDLPAAAVLAVVLFGTSGLGLDVWLFVVVPLCALAWALWSLASAPRSRGGQHRRPGPPVRLPHL